MVTTPSLERQFSTGSFASTASSSSLLPPLQDEEPTIEDGLPHSSIILNARKYKSPAFISSLLHVLRELRASSWTDSRITGDLVRIDKVAGSLTNAVFFVSYPTLPNVRTVLLRIYGSSSGSLIQRSKELHTLFILSSLYGIGPKLYGTFDNGRIEEYFESDALTAQDLRDPKISRWIGARMAELHSVDIGAVENGTGGDLIKGNQVEIAAKRNVLAWLPPAQQVLELPFLSDVVKQELDLVRFKACWDQYMRHLDTLDKVEKGSRRVFCHNDTQYGNLLRLRNPKAALEEHRQIIVVDFEYASPNPATFDIANHFLEWTANYHGDSPHILDSRKYPTFEERRNFYLSYLGHAIFDSLSKLTETDREAQVQDLDDQVCYWTPASHAMWAVWGLVQATEDVRSQVLEPEFDYIGYSRCRMSSFYRELKRLGLD